MEDKEKVAKAIFADQLTHKRLIQIDDVKGLRRKDKSILPYTNSCGQTGRTNHDLILKQIYQSMGDLIEHVLLFFNSNIQTHDMNTFFDNGDYYDLFRLSGIGKRDYIRWVEESLLEHMAGAFSGAIAAVVASDQSDNPNFWPHFSNAVLRYHSTLRYMDNSLSYGSGGAYASAQSPYSQPYASAAGGGRASASAGYGFGGGMSAYGFGATSSNYGNSSTSQYGSQSSRQSGASGFEAFLNGLGSSAAGGGGSYGRSTSYSFTPQAGSMRYSTAASTKRAVVPNFCNEGSTAHEIHDYSNRSAGQGSGNAQVKLIDAVLNAVKLKLNHHFTVLSKDELLIRINTWIDADREAEIKKYEREDAAIANTLKAKKNKVKTDIAEATFPAAFWGDTTAEETANALSAVFAYLDRFYSTRIGLWMGSFVTESVEAKNGNGTSCQKGIRERIVTGLRVLNDSELNAIFAGPEAFEMMKRFWVSLNFHDDVENARRLTNNLKARPYGVTRHSTTKVAAIAFRRYIVDYIQSQGLSESYVNTKTRDNYPEQINTMVDLFSEYYDEKIKIHM